MSLLPLLLNEYLEGYRRPLYDLYNQSARSSFFDDDIHSMLASAPLRSGYLRPWRNLAASDSGISSIELNDKEYKINLDVQQFKPDELKVKVVSDCIVIEGKHDERSDEHGFVSRQFTRRYKIPSNINAEGLTSKLSSDGILSLSAPKKDSPGSNAREIPITITNKPALKEKESKPAAAGSEAKTTEESTPAQASVDQEKQFEESKNIEIKLE